MYIAQLVDSIAHLELLSFLDAYKGYHQLLMAEEYMAKTAFVTDDCIYCYTCMPFGLKNAGADFENE